MESRTQAVTAKAKMNFVTFEIYRGGHEILIEVDPVDDTTGYVTKDVPCKDGILFFEGFPVELSKAAPAVLFARIGAGPLEL